jgi:hypothetical protein
MKILNPIVILSSFIFLSVSCIQAIKENKIEPDFRIFYVIVWKGETNENLSYARQMKYDYVFYQKGMEKDSLSKGLYFYIETPEYAVYPRRIDTKQLYSRGEIEFFETNCAIMNNSKVFPHNIARGWFMNDHTFTPQLDFQQQRVISWTIDSILKNVEAIEAQNPDFHFGGFAWDVPQPAGDFWDTIQHPGHQITLKHWTGGDFGIKNKGAVHNFPTYSDGRLEYYKQLYRATRKKYPAARFMMEPYRIYEDWIAVVKNRHDAKEVTPDLLVQERFGIEFVTDARIFESELISKEFVGSTTPDRFGEADNRLFAASAAINGAWFSWYGRFGGTGDMPRFNSIAEVPYRLKLIRVLANWENLNQTPLSKRLWDGTTYQSPTAFASPDAIAVMQPHTGKLFVVFVTEKGEIALPKDKRIAAIYKADALFREAENDLDEVKVRSGILKPKTVNNLNGGYVIHFK